MKTYDKEFLHKILNLASPTGGEQDLQRYLAEWAKPFADRIEADFLGNLAVVINPDAKLCVMLAGHCDKIGFMVMDITQQGYLRVDPLGGIDEATVLGARVIVRSKNGDVPGVFGKVSTHVQTINEQDKVPKIDDVWIDIGATSKEDAETMVSIGDHVFYEPNIVELGDARITGPALDNMLGLYVIMYTAKRCAEKNINVALYCVSTVQEEIGSRGAESAASAIKPAIAIAVDTTIAIDTPGKPKTRTTPDIKLGEGPSILRGPNGHPIVGRLLIDAAKAANLPYQLELNAKEASNDAKPMQLADGGTAAGSVGIPLRNMHTQVEVASMEDVENTIQLLTQFVCSLKKDQDLLPINADVEGNSLDKVITTPGLGVERNKKPHAA